MKQLSPIHSYWLDGDHTIKPRFLIEIELDEVLHLSTGDTITDDDSKEWIGGLVQGLRIGQDTATFGLVNDSYKYTTPALTGDYQRAPVKIWAFATPSIEPYMEIVDDGYVDPGYYDLSRGDPLLVFQGNISRFTQITTILGVEATRSAARQYPRLRVLPPIANYLKPEGSVITFGDQTYILEPR